MHVRYPPPGRLVDLGTHRLHLLSVGEGAPTVVFDAALGASSLSWTLVQPAVGRLTRTCAYDRAGFGWSEPGPMPRRVDRLAEELHELLHRGSEPGPFVLVGHSFGGLVVRVFRARYPDEVVGVVLIEPASPEEWATPGEAQRALVRRGVRLCQYGATAVRWGIARVVAGSVRLGTLGPARLVARLASRWELRPEDEHITAPAWKLPPEARRVLGQVWTRPGFFEALGSQIATISESAKYVLAIESDSWGDLPLLVITAEDADSRRFRADSALTRLSTRSHHVRVTGSGHWVMLDAPAAVSEAITAFVELIRVSSER
jgi:pimeloyl-ACP methyl ester carboxylesterase